MKARAVVRLCLTPKSPDVPLTRAMTSDYTRNWTVLHDPEGTFPDGNRLGQQDIYYGLINYSFVPGTILLQYYDAKGKSVNRTWTVKIRYDHHNQQIMDAYCYVKHACGEKNLKTALRIAWLRQQGFGRQEEQPAGQLELELV